MPSKFILVVDDEFIILHTLRMQLERSFPQLNIESASDKAEVEEILQDLLTNKQQLLAVIADYHLGDCKGTDIIRMVHTYYPEAAKSILTGIADTSTIPLEPAEVFKNLRFFQKPWEIDAVVDYLQPLVV